MTLLPDPRRRGEIQFKVAKSLPYDVRLALIAGGIGGGIALQLALGIAWPGAPLVLAASLLSLVSGYTNVPSENDGKLEWKPVSRHEVERVLQLHEASRKWDQSLLDITCRTGIAALVAAGGFVAGVAYLLRDSPALMTTWVTDAFLILSPQWVTGVRRILTRPGLVIKVKALLEVADSFEKTRAPNEAFQWMMELRHRLRGEIPEDVKLMVKYADAPEAFLGVQVQVNLNDVQGTTHPYLYCVVLARPGFGLRHLVSNEKEITEEFQEQNDVELIVIRQHTTRTSGYNTKPKVQREIFRRAVQRGRLALERKNP